MPKLNKGKSGLAKGIAKVKAIVKGNKIRGSIKEDIKQVEKTIEKIQCRSAIYYQNNSEARERKKAYDSQLCSRPDLVQKRVECNRMRRQARQQGTIDIEGKDYDHFTRRFIDSSVNRGRKGEGNRVEGKRY